MRFMGSLTVLLVLVSILASIKESVPKTSGLIMIDAWLLFIIASVFLVILFHVCIERIEVMTVSPLNGGRAVWCADDTATRREHVNNFAKVTFALKTLVFICVYVVITFKLNSE